MSGLEMGLAATKLEEEGSTAAVVKPGPSRKQKWVHKKGELEVDWLGEEVKGVKMGEEEEMDGKGKGEEEL